MPHRRLVLLDIDGTILHGGKLWRDCFEGSFLESVEGLAGTGDFAGGDERGVDAGVTRGKSKRRLPRISFSGKTDRQICRELMIAAGYWEGHGEVSPADQEAREKHIDRILRGYLDRAKVILQTRAHEVKIMPGVRELIMALSAHGDVTLGLLTGNVREGAELKLGSVGLGGHFKMGVFGDDHWDRYELPAIAVERARVDLGREFAGKQVVIVGDTIHDIGCGQKVGARAIGVGTGHAESRDRVHGAWKGLNPGDPKPDHYFEDLSDLAAVLRAILGAG